MRRNKKIFQIRAKTVLKIKWSVKTPRHERVELARSGYGLLQIPRSVILKALQLILTLRRFTLRHIITVSKLGQFTPSWSFFNCIVSPIIKKIKIIVSKLVNLLSELRNYWKLALNGGGPFFYEVSNKKVPKCSWFTWRDEYYFKTSPWSLILEKPVL